MSNYENGIETKKRILAACRKLFYQKGYDQTTFKDICAEAQVNQSSIHYHFKTKENLLTLIYEETIEKNNREASRYLSPDMPSLTRFCLSTMLYYYKLLKDPLFFRLNLDAALYLESSHFDGQIQIYAKGLLGNEQSYIVLSEDSFFDLMAVTGFDRSLLIYLSKEHPPIDLGELTRRTLLIYKKLVGIDSKSFDAAMEQVRVLQDRIKWDEMDTSLEI